MNNAKSRLGCTVSPKYSLLFASTVSWQKVDKNGNEVDEDDDITQGNGNVETGTNTGGSGGGSGSGSGEDEG